MRSLRALTLWPRGASLKTLPRSGRLQGLEARPKKERDEMQAAGQRLEVTYLEAYNQGRAEGTVRE